MRRIPIRLQPSPGEALDSWIIAYAARLRAPVADLAGALGLDPGFVRQPARHVALGDRLGDAIPLVASSGLLPTEVTSLWQPLARYARVTRQRFRKFELGRGARVLAWSRFCPACLDDNGGRWPAAWRLPWWVACPVHETLLASSCPACGGHQRSRPIHRDFESRTMTTCSIPRTGASGRGDHTCGQSLVTSPCPGPACPEVLAIQAGLRAVLDHAASDEAVASDVDHVADLLTVATVGGFCAGCFSDAGLGDTAAISTVLVKAERMLEDSTGRPFVDLATADVRRRPPPLPRGWVVASPKLVSRVLCIRDPSLRPADRLRWRTTTVGTRPSAEEGLRCELGRWIPQALWSDWSIRLRPREGLDPYLFRRVAAACLLLPGATATLERLVSGFMAEAPSRHEISHVLGRVRASGHSTAIIRALTQLADHIRRQGSPIDYERRRRIAETVPLLDELAWGRICRAAGTPPGGPLKLKGARQWIWEALTGGLVQQAPGGLRADAGGGLNHFHGFVLRLPPLAGELLDAQARRVLDDNGCGSEPLLWSPPLSGLTWRGFPDPIPRVSAPRRSAASFAESSQWAGLPTAWARPKSMSASSFAGIRHRFGPVR